MENIQKKTFTANVFVPNSTSPKYIPNCIIYKGKLVQLIEIGVGDVQHHAARNEEGDYDQWETYNSYTTKMKPYLSRFLTADKFDYFNNLLKKSKSILTPENEEEILAVSFVLGENIGGYRVTNKEAEQEKEYAEHQKKVSNREIPIEIKEYNFGYSISEKLPSEIWNKLRPHATYWTAEEIDDWNDDNDDFTKVGDGRYMKGWYYTEAIIEILKNLNFEIILK